MLKLIIRVVITTANFDRLWEAVMSNPAPVCHRANVSKTILAHGFRWGDFHVAPTY